MERTSAAVAALRKPYGAPRPQRPRIPPRFHPTGGGRDTWITSAYPPPPEERAGDGPVVGAPRNEGGGAPRFRPAKQPHRKAWQIADADNGGGGSLLGGHYIPAQRERPVRQLADSQKADKPPAVFRGPPRPTKAALAKQQARYDPQSKAFNPRAGWPAAERRPECEPRPVNVRGWPPEKVFRLFDRDGSGELSMREFRLGLKALGFDTLPDAQFRALFVALDTSGNGKISLDEFVQAYALLRKRMPPPP